MSSFLRRRRPAFCARFSARYIGAGVLRQRPVFWAAVSRRTAAFQTKQPWMSCAPAKRNCNFTSGVFVVSKQKPAVPTLAFLCLSAPTRDSLECFKVPRARLHPKGTNLPPSCRSRCGGFCAPRAALCVQIIQLWCAHLFTCVTRSKSRILLWGLACRHPCMLTLTTGGKFLGFHFNGSSLQQFNEQ